MTDNARIRSVRLGLLLTASIGWAVISGCSRTENLGLAGHGDRERAPENRAALARVDDAPIDVPIAADADSIPGAAEGDAAPPSEGAASRESTNAAADPPVPPAHRDFVVEGPDGALRVGFDDLDLLKLLRMDPVTPDCVEKMPGWLRGLDGKTVRIRGFMKPGLLLEGIPQFMCVRDTGLCCFGPKGKIYDMIAVTLKEGTTTSYIELRPFDVVGKFRIELLELEEDGTIFGLYYIDDARIIQK
jgi:hypothetical protein